MAATDAQRSEEYGKITRRVAEEAWGQGNFEVVDEHLADDFVSHTTALPEDVRGREAYKELITTFRSAFPDLEVRVVDTLVDGDEVAIRFTTTGTHEGALMGIEPTGKKLENSGLVIARFEDGQGVEVWEYGDQLGLLRQLGVVELPSG